MMKKIILFLISFAIIQSIVQSYPYPQSSTASFYPLTSAASSSQTSSATSGYEPQEPMPITHDGGIYDPVVQVDLDLSAGVPGQYIPGLGAPAPSSTEGGGGGGGGGGGNGNGNNGGTPWWAWWLQPAGGNGGSGGSGGNSGGGFGTHWWDWWLKPLFGWIKWFWGLFFPKFNS